MPQNFDKIKDTISSSLKGKTNPKTNKPYSESDIYAISTSVYQKKYGRNP